MSNLHGIILGYNGDENLRELTEARTTASVPFCARYRIIDFLLSTLVNAGVDDIGIILQESYQSLLDHLGAGREWDLSRKNGGLKLLPPFSTGRNRGAGFAGGMDALLSVRSYIERIRKDYVFIARGNTIASFDLGAVLENHIRSGADVTAICVHESSELRSEIRLVFREDGFARDMLLGGDLGDGLVGTGMYIMSTKRLLALMDECAVSGEPSFSRALKSSIDRLKIMNYIVNDFIARPNSVAQYYRLSMKLLDAEVRASLFPKGRPVLTKLRDEAPTYYAPGAAARNCLVADGCYIEGEAENCIIFRGVKIAKGARVRGCILMQDTVVGEDTVLDGIITDKNVVIGKNRTFIGSPEYPTVIAKGTVL